MKTQYYLRFILMILIAVAISVGLSRYKKKTEEEMVTHPGPKTYAPVLYNPDTNLLKSICDNDYVVLGDDVTLSFSTLKNFKYLSEIQHIEGDFTIEYSDHLYDFSGLENLISLDCDFTVNSNANFHSFNGLDNLEFVIKNFTIANNMSLNDISGNTYYPDEDNIMNGNYSGELY